MKILFLATPFENLMRYTARLDEINYPLGIIYLYSILEKKGNNVNMLFCNNDVEDVYVKKLRTELENNKPDIICLNILTMSRVSAFWTIEHIKEYYPNIKIIIGGVHSCIAYEQLLKKYPQLVAVIGEGEITLVELINNIDNPKMWKEIKGLAYTKKEKLVVTEERELIEDLDILPIPKHEYFFKEGNRTHAYLISSRGCPFKCSFCCLHTISKRRYRKRSIENIIREIDYLMLKFPQIKTVEFSDDTLLLDLERSKKLMKAIIKKEYNVRFRCSARFKPFDLELAKLMEQAGFHTVLFGLETGSEELLKSIHKMITKEDVIKTWEIMAQTTIKPVPFFIVGFPGETQETINESIEFLRRLKKIKHFWYYDIGLLNVYPNTEVYEIMKEKGKINDNYWMNEHSSQMYTVEHSYEQLLEFKNQVIFKTMMGLDIFRFIVSLILVRIRKTEQPRFMKDKLFLPILKKLLFIW